MTEAMKGKKNSILLESTEIKGYVFSNRYVCAPFDIAKAENNGIITEELLTIYGSRVGPSLIIVEQAAVAKAGQYRERLIFTDRDECINGLEKLANVIHQNNQVAVMQINHAGSAADISLTGLEAVAPSAVIHPTVKRSMPRALTVLEIKEIKEAFIQAALRVKEAGFDGVEIHNCHGFLLSQFLSPLTNKRSDEYGGSLDNRSRLLLEIVKGVRKAVGEEFLLLVRLGLDDFLSGGMTAEDGCLVAEKLQEAGIDILDISTGLMSPLSLPGPAMLRELLKKAKAHVTIPVIGAGALENIEIAADMVEKEEVDFIALARKIMKQPNYVEELLETINTKV
ncbi:NADH:flavin oxidoreductase [Niallia sp. NCCP-28]|uniref:NADH:flavin oxidoreductase n=1 Tax=Niallia sp. NCCP-28 TaxID=2934712 RepID=UPI00207DA47D|nr:NADH:flavin oxidoreductase [Niallia sp. NCCP-28]GKU84386.1 NADH oxidase [Niallia sp. NCCP-28]